MEGAPAAATAVPDGACFTYGSLMCADIMARVCKCPVGHLPASDAILFAHTRHPVAGQVYPGLRASAEPQERVAGVLYTGVDAAMLARLDAFEGDDYERVAVQVVPSSAATPVWAWVYRWRADRADRLLPGAWDVERFMQQGRQRFVARHF